MKKILQTFGWCFWHKFSSHCKSFEHSSLTWYFLQVEPHLQWWDWWWWEKPSIFNFDFYLNYEILWMNVTGDVWYKQCKAPGVGRNLPWGQFNLPTPKAFTLFNILMKACTRWSQHMVWFGDFRRQRFGDFCLKLVLLCTWLRFGYFCCKLVFISN